MPEFGPDKPQARRHFRCQLTRDSKIDVFSQLEPFAKLRNRIRFSKFQMPYGSFFDAVHKNAVEIGFREISFFAILKRISGFWPEKKKSPIQPCRDRPAIHKCAFGSSRTSSVAIITAGPIRQHNHRGQLSSLASLAAAEPLPRGRTAFGGPYGPGATTTTTTTTNVPHA